MWLHKQTDAKKKCKDVTMLCMMMIAMMIYIHTHVDQCIHQGSGWLWDRTLLSMPLNFLTLLHHPCSSTDWFNNDKLVATMYSVCCLLWDDHPDDLEKSG